MNVVYKPEFWVYFPDNQRKFLEKFLDFYRSEWPKAIFKMKSIRRTRKIPEYQGNKPKTQVIKDVT